MAPPGGLSSRITVPSYPARGCPNCHFPEKTTAAKTHIRYREDQSWAIGENAFAQFTAYAARGWPFMIAPGQYYQEMTSALT